MTGKEVEKYIMRDLGYITEMAEEINANERELMELLLNNKPINSLMTHSYGFHTASGRGIINNLTERYYEYN